MRVHVCPQNVATLNSSVINTSGQAGTERNIDVNLQEIKRGYQHAQIKTYLHVVQAYKIVNNYS